MGAPLLLAFPGLLCGSLLFLLLLSHLAFLLRVLAISAVRSLRTAAAAALAARSAASAVAAAASSLSASCLPLGSSSLVLTASRAADSKRKRDEQTTAAMKVSPPTWSRLALT